MGASAPRMRPKAVRSDRVGASRAFPGSRQRSVRRSCKGRHSCSSRRGTAPPRGPRHGARQCPATGNRSRRALPECRPWPPCRPGGESWSPRPRSRREEHHRERRPDRVRATSRPRWRAGDGGRLQIARAGLRPSRAARQSVAVERGTCKILLDLEPGPMQGTAPGAIGDDRGADWPFVSPSEDQARGAGSCLGLVFDVRASPVSRSGAPGVSGIGREPGQAHICRRSSWLTLSGLAETSPSVCQADPCSGSGRAHTRW